MTQKRILTNIQQLRGIAASLVVLSHVLESTFKRVLGEGIFVVDGLIGVDIFFVISGFIMVGVTHGAYGRSGSARDFMVRRVARIVPIYWILTTVMALLFLIAGSPPGFLDTVCSYLFLPLDHDGKVRPILGQGWTLELEMMFYIIFSICLTFRKTVGLTLLCVTLVVLPIVGIFIDSGPFEFWFSPILIEFLIGIGVGIAYRQWDRELFSGHLIAIGVLLAVWLGAVHLLGRETMYDWRPLSWLLAGAIVAAAVFARQTAGKSFGARALIWLGDVSYSLYLVHIIVLLIAAKVSDSLLGERLTPAIGGLYAAAVIIGSIAAAAITYRLLERPTERLARKWLSSASAIPGPADQNMPSQGTQRA